MYPRKGTPVEGLRRYGHAGKCHACYERARWAQRRGGPPVRLSRRVVLEEMVFFRDVCGWSYPRIAERLGLSWPAFDKHMRESCRAGDPRTAGYSGVSVSEERAA